MNQTEPDLPLVSVIIPAYNAEAFIGETLESVLSQTYRNIEVLVVDDGSQDRTREIVEKFVERDIRVILVQQANAGVAAARNLAIEKSQGDYIAPIDADDLWYPEKLKKQVECMLRSPDSVGLVYCWSVHPNEKGELIWKNNVYKDYYAHQLEGKVYLPLVYRNFIGSASVPLIRRSCFNKVGGYNTKLRAQNAQGCEDWDLYLRIAEIYEFHLVPEFLVGYRQVAGSMASNCLTMARSYEFVMADVKQKFPQLPAKIYQWSAGYFYNYLIGKSCGGDDRLITLICILKALRADPAVILRPGLYKLSISCILQVLLRPIIKLIWQHREDWLKFRQRFAPSPTVVTVADINRKILQPQKLGWKPYDRILLRRWAQVVNSEPQSPPPNPYNPIPVQSNLLPKPIPSWRDL